MFTFKYINSKFLKSKLISKKFCDKIEQPKGLFDKLKKFGKFGLIFYSSYVAIAYATFYLLLEYKYLDVNKVIDWFESRGLNKYINIRKRVSKANPKLVNLIVAYILNQVFEVVRLPTTILFLTYWMRRRK
jgi:hypothetical protein